MSGSGVPGTAALPGVDELLAAGDAKACCAALYEHSAVRWLLGGELRFYEHVLSDGSGLARMQNAVALVLALGGRRVSPESRHADRDRAGRVRDRALRALHLPAVVRDGAGRATRDRRSWSAVKPGYFTPLLGFLLPSLLIGFGVVIPGSCIAGINNLTVGFATSLLGASVAYWLGIRSVLSDRSSTRSDPGSL